MCREEEEEDLKWRQYQDNGYGRKLRRITHFW
jgi:hypothetical protein